MIKAERSGVVIHPDAAKWETAPIAEGATVYSNQRLLLMPDLSKMQVKVGIHESVVDRVKSGQSARVPGDYDGRRHRAHQLCVQGR